MFTLDTPALRVILAPMQSAEESQLWSPGPSLWSLITEHVSGPELPKIHAALGSSLVDVYTEAHAEAATWHQMWRESRGGDGSRGGGGAPPPRRERGPPLADPPAVKELVRGEVRMLLQTLRERSSRQGRVDEEPWIRYKPEAVDYALGRPDGSRGGAGGADDGSRPGSHCSVRSNADDEIEAVRHRLNVGGIDQVAERLRSVLTEECETLNRMVTHFKGNFKQKWRSPCEVDKSEPSLAELRALRGAIQVDLQLYPSSLSVSQAASPPLGLRELKKSFRLPAAQQVSDETLRALSSTSAFRPRPPPVSRPAPRPPPSEASASPKAADGCSPSRLPAEQRSTSASAGPGKLKAPVCNGIADPAQANRHFATSLRGPVSLGGISPGLHSPALCVRTPTSRPESPEKTHRGNSHVHETHPSPRRGAAQDSSRRGDLLPTEGKRSPSWRSRNIGPVFTKSPGGPCPHPAAVVINGQLFTSPRKALESVTSQAKGVRQAELELISKCCQPVPPARVTT